VRVHAAAVTPTEQLWRPSWKTRTGEARPFPIILGHEFSGVIASLGAGVSEGAEGDPVYGLNDWFADGAHMEADRSQLVEIAGLIDGGQIRVFL
jgi:NADPH:quinone reductase-like Zn-dependent oxidoreductase